MMVCHVKLPVSIYAIDAHLKPSVVTERIRRRFPMTLNVASAILARRATKVFDAEHRMPEEDLETILGWPVGCRLRSISRTGASWW